MLIHPADERNFIAIAKIMETTEFTNITGTPSVYARVLQFVRNPFPKVRYLISGGESLTMPLFTKIKACFPEAILYNEYGPAECCIVATCGIITGKNTLNNIGEPINNTALFIDGEQMKGELYITGVGTSGRYLDETMNTGTFFPNPWQPHMQVYRTGDVVNRQKNRFVYVNRLDDIVKINGLMVDKKEVKQALLEHENILDAKVTVENDENGQTFLAAYVQLQTNPLDEPALRKELQQKLLYYMIPTKLISVLSLPLDEHGKTIVPKQTALQTSREIIAEKVLQCWKTVLQQDTLKTDQSFFEQGGNSLLFIDLFLLLNEEYEGMITVPELMEFYTIQNQINFLYNKLNEKEKETL